MISKRLAIILSGVTAAVVIVAFLIFAFQISSNGQTIWTSVIEPQITLKAILSVNSEVLNSRWERNTSTDLPSYVNEVYCYVRNTGNTAASNVKLEVKVDGKIIATPTFSSIPIQAVETYSFSVTMPYDSTRSLFLWASCQDSENTYSFSIEGNFPRYLDESKPDLAKLFITPKETNVVSLENRILKDKLFIIPNWIAIRDWVGNNVQYREDTGGAGDHWKFAKETMSSGTGDCEDHAILLCSLLRVSGYSSNDVFVVVGQKGNDYHAWVKVNLGILGWYNLEPQANGWNTLIGDFLSLSGFEGIYQFNDYQFKNVT